ncbi:aminotransferase class IV family protein [Streptomyces sp. NPDC019396]|uniref:aminotransferase class IV family protein n=1 Tax=Streptomyces sp. NPDC019396 TaxID=3154687 RepID=UPI0033E66A10
MAELNGRPVGPDALLALGLTNYGHFTSMRVDDERVRGLDLHLARLARDCRTVFGAELDLDRVRHHVRHAAGDKAGSFVVRVTVFDPGIDIGHPSGADSPDILVTIRPAAAFPLAPLRAKTVRYERDVPTVKHLGLFGSLHARRSAQLNGFDDALFTSRDGLVGEGGTWNVGFLTGAGIVWPEADVLPGVTMALLQRLAEHTVAPVTVAEAQGAQAAFATNAAIGVRPLSCIDDARMADGDPRLTVLREAYRALPGDRL